MAIKAAMFDMDGVIMDSMPVWKDAGAIYLRKLGKDPEENLGNVLFAMTLLDGARYMKEKYELELSIEEILQAINDTMVDEYRYRLPLKKDIDELIKKLSEAGVKLVIATSSTRPMVEAAFERFGFMKYFEKVFSADEMGIGKNSELFFEKVLEYLQVDAGDAMLFEDGLYSVITAHRMGIKCVGVYDEVSKADQAELIKLCDYYLAEDKNYLETFSDLV